MNKRLYRIHEYLDKHEWMVEDILAAPYESKFWACECGAYGCSPFRDHPIRNIKHVFKTFKQLQEWYGYQPKHIRHYWMVAGRR